MAHQAGVLKTSYLVVALIVLVPLAAVAVIGRPIVVVLVGLGLATAEWIWAIVDGSDPANGGEFHGAELVVLTFTFALLGFLVWCAGALLGWVVRGQWRGQ